MARADPESTRPIGWSDVGVAAGFALYAALFQLGRTHGFSPFLFLGGDAGNLASYAALHDPAASFAGDGALGNPERVGFYATVHIPLIYGLRALTGDYGSAVASMLGAHVFVQALGFYALGRVLLRNRFYALLLAATTLMPVWVHLSTYWGTYADPQPRFTYQALLPWLLAAALLARERPRRALAVAALSGLGAYVHPVSAPAWMLAIWLGLGSAQSGDASRRRRLATRAACAAAALAVAAPFVWITLAGHGTAPDAEQIPAIRAVLGRIMPAGFFDIGSALRAFASLWLEPRGVLWIGAALGAAGVWRLGDAEDRQRLGIVALWLAGVLVASVGLPFLDQQQAAARGRLPFAPDLARALRYVVPLLWIVTFWSLAIVQRRLAAARWPARTAVALAAVAFCGGWILRHPPPEIASAAGCLRAGRLACPPASWSGKVEAVEVVQRATPPGATILPSSLTLPIRYHALRPVVHSGSDLGVLLYAEPTALPRWYAILRETLRAVRLRERDDRFRAWMQIARALGADYAFVDRNFFDAPLRTGGTHLGEAVTWAAPHYALIDLAPQ